MAGGNAPDTPSAAMTQYRRFMTYPAAGDLRRKIALHLPAGMSGRPFLSVLAAGGDIVLNIEIDAAANRMVAAQRLGGVWVGRIERALPPQGGGLDFTLDIAPGSVGVVFGDGTALEWPLARRETGQIVLEGTGAWRVQGTVAATLSGQDLGDLTQADVPRRGLGGQYMDDLVFDIGANNGDDTWFYLAKGFRVVAVDANPRLCEMVAQRFHRQVADGQLVVLNVGIAQARGRLTFYVNDRHDEWSSFDRAIASRGHPVREIVVPTVTPGDLFDGFGVPRYLKVDIEGHDAVVVVAAAAHPVKPRFLSFENGALELFEALARAGYDRFQIVNQARVQDMRCPVPAREGLTVSHAFPRGSSGPFGGDLPEDAWQNAAAMRATLKQHLAQVALRPDTETGAWYDMHAARRD